MRAAGRARVPDARAHDEELAAADASERQAGPEDAEQALVRVRHAPVRCRLEHADRQRLGEAVQEPFPCPQRILRRHLVGDVQHRW